MIVGQNNLGTNVLGKKSGVLKKLLVLVETIGISEQTIKSIKKSIIETLSITEARSYVQLKTMILLETIGITEILRKSVAITFIENIGISDLLSRGIGKILTETINITESFIDVVKRVAHSLYGRITKSSKYHGIKKNNLSGKIKRL